MVLPMPTSSPLPYKLCSHLQNVSKQRLLNTAIPFTPMNLGIAGILLRQGFISSVTRAGPPVDGKPIDPTVFNSLGPQQRALHLSLKYRNAQPVLTRAELVSKPSKHIYFTVPELRAHLTGGRVHKTRGLGMGDVVIIRTLENRYLEGWEAVAEGVGGEAIMVVG